MELEVGEKVSGQIWNRKSNVAREEGLLIKVKGSMLDSSFGPSRNIRFLKASFDNRCDQFIAGDHLGHIFLFDISKNRFALVKKVGQPCTAIAYSLHHRKEFLVGLGDCSLKCYGTDKGELIAEMKGHKSAIHSISVHMSGNFALTTSAETTHLWNLNTFKKKHKLHIKEDVGLLQTFFLPNSNTVLTCFCDNTIFAWDLDSMSCKYQLPVPSGSSPQYRAFAASQDSRYLVAGGKTQFLHMWHLDTKRLIRVIELPTKVKAVKQLEFLNYGYQHGINQMLGVLSLDGILRFIDIDTCKLLFDIGSEASKIIYVAIGPGGHHIVTIMDDGKLHIYNIDALRPDLNKPPLTVMKVATGIQLSDTVNTKSSLRLSNSSQKSTRLETKAFSLKNGETDHEDADLKGLNIIKLQTILKGFGEYPAKYRMFIWRKILQLPDNFSTYAALVDKGAHHAFSKLHEVYPIKSHKLLRVLQRILSALAHWSPVFGETQYLPSFAFPFVRLYQNNHLVCFELIATIIVNWSQHWFEYFPNPPINILGMIENVLCHHDLQLLQHFVKCGVTSQIYAWPLLETVFSEVLTQDEWLMLWDNILSNHAAFLIMIVVAYNICARGSLMKCTDMEDFQFFFHHRNAISVRQVVNKAYSLMESSPSNIHPQNKLDVFVPLTKGNYPVFNKYPKCIVDYQVRERERIHEEELEYLRQKNINLHEQKETLQKREEEEQWYRQNKLLLEAEDRRKRMIHEEESKLTEQRKRLLAMNREVKIKEITLLEATRQKFLLFQKEQREIELKRLDDVLQRKALQRDQETETAIHEAEVVNMEILLRKKLLEQELCREYTAQSQAQRTEHDMCFKQTELEDQLKLGMKEAERNRELEARKKSEVTIGYDSTAAKRTVEARNKDCWMTDTNEELLKTNLGMFSNHESMPSETFCDISQVSFDRNRCAFGDKEALSLHEIRQLRQRLAKDSRDKLPQFPAAKNDGNFYK